MKIVVGRLLTAFSKHLRKGPTLRFTRSFSRHRLRLCRAWVTSSSPVPSPLAKHGGVRPRHLLYLRRGDSLADDPLEPVLRAQLLGEVTALQPQPLQISLDAIALVHIAQDQRVAALASHLEGRQRHLDGKSSRIARSAVNPSGTQRYAVVSRVRQPLLATRPCLLRPLAFQLRMCPRGKDGETERLCGAAMGMGFTSIKARCPSTPPDYSESGTAI
jgi:hypothetical protein